MTLYHDFPLLLLTALALTTQPAIARAQNIQLGPSLHPEVGVLISGNLVNSVNGRLVSPLGDFNGDGIDDILFGDPIGGTNQSGGSYIVFGRSGNWQSFNFLAIDNDSSLGIRITSNGTTNVGTTTAPAGDFNGDGYADALIGSNAGAYVVFGTPDSSSINLQQLDTSNVAGFKITGGGRYLCSAGDFNGDGLGDIVVNHVVPSGTSGYKNNLRVIFGKSTGIANISLNDFPASDMNGFGVAGGDLYNHAPAGDFNGDGYDDILIGGESTLCILYGKPSGHVDLDLNGSSANFSRTWISGICGADGSRYLSGSDFNGDGLSDVVIGSLCAPASPPGQKQSVYVVYGQSNPPAVISADDIDTTKAHGFRIYGPPNELHGNISSDAGDVNGDGLSDLLVLGGNFSGGSSHYIIYGLSPHPTSDITLAYSSFPGPLGYRVIGTTVTALPGLQSAAGDVNNDGYNDFVINEFVSGSRSLVGNNYIIFGRSALSASINEWIKY